jgi:hypothetical protein
LLNHSARAEPPANDIRTAAKAINRERRMSVVSVLLMADAARRMTALAGPLRRSNGAP